MQMTIICTLSESSNAFVRICGIFFLEYISSGPCIFLQKNTVNLMLIHLHNKITQIKVIFFVKRDLSYLWTPSR